MSILNRTKKVNFIFTLLFFALSLSLNVLAATVGKKAPDFKEFDSKGVAHQLSDFKGKYVVLEWMNKDCPYVKKHYSSKNMQGLQKEYAAKGVVWLSIVSSVEGKQGHLSSTEANEVYKEKGMNSTALILDTDASMAKAYSAKVTPHMYIINPEGVLVYNGAIDDNDSSDSADIKTSKNYVKIALDDLMSGRKVANASTKPYGCGVKY